MDYRTTRTNDSNRPQSMESVEALRDQHTFEKHSRKISTKEKVITGLGIGALATSGIALIGGGTALVVTGVGAGPGAAMIVGGLIAEGAALVLLIQFLARTIFSKPTMTEEEFNEIQESMQEELKKKIEEEKKVLQKVQDEKARLEEEVDSLQKTLEGQRQWAIGEVLQARRDKATAETENAKKLAAQDEELRKAKTSLSDQTRELQELKDQLQKVEDRHKQTIAEMSEKISELNNSKEEALSGLYHQQQQESQEKDLENQQVLDELNLLKEELSKKEKSFEEIKSNFEEQITTLNEGIELKEELVKTKDQRLELLKDQHKERVAQLKKDLKSKHKEAEEKLSQVSQQKKELEEQVQSLKEVQSKLNSSIENLKEHSEDLENSLREQKELNKQIEQEKVQYEKLAKASKQKTAESEAKLAESEERLAELEQKLIEVNQKVEKLQSQLQTQKALVQVQTLSMVGGADPMLDSSEVQALLLEIRNTEIHVKNILIKQKENLSLETVQLLRAELNKISLRAFSLGRVYSAVESPQNLPVVVRKGMGEAPVRVTIQDAPKPLLIEGVGNQQQQQPQLVPTPNPIPAHQNKETIAQPRSPSGQRKTVPPVSIHRSPTPPSVSISDAKSILGKSSTEHLIKVQEACDTLEQNLVSGDHIKEKLSRKNRLQERKKLFGFANQLKEKKVNKRNEEIQTYTEASQQFDQELKRLKPDFNHFPHWTENPEDFLKNLSEKISSLDSLIQKNSAQRKEAISKIDNWTASLPKDSEDFKKLLSKKEELFQSLSEAEKALNTYRELQSFVEEIEERKKNLTKKNGPNLKKGHSLVEEAKQLLEKPDTSAEELQAIEQQLEEIIPSIRKCESYFHYNNFSIKLRVGAKERNERTWFIKPLNAEKNKFLPQVENQLNSIREARQEAQIREGKAAFKTAESIVDDIKRSTQTHSLKDLKSKRDECEKRVEKGVGIYFSLLEEFQKKAPNKPINYDNPIAWGVNVRPSSQREIFESFINPGNGLFTSVKGFPQKIAEIDEILLTKEKQEEKARIEQAMSEFEEIAPPSKKTKELAEAEKIKQAEALYIPETKTKVTLETRQQYRFDQGETEKVYKNRELHARKSQMFILDRLNTEFSLEPGKSSNKAVLASWMPKLYAQMNFFPQLNQKKDKAWHADFHSICRDMFCISDSSPQKRMQNLVTLTDSIYKNEEFQKDFETYQGLSKEEKKQQFPVIYALHSMVDAFYNANTHTEQEKMLDGVLKDAGATKAQKVFIGKRDGKNPRATDIARNNWHKTKYNFPSNHVGSTVAKEYSKGIATTGYGEWNALLYNNVVHKLADFEIQLGRRSKAKQLNRGPSPTQDRGSVTGGRNPEVASIFKLWIEGGDKVVFYGSNQKAKVGVAVEGLRNQAMLTYMKEHSAKELKAGRKPKFIFWQCGVDSHLFEGKHQFKGPRTVDELVKQYSQALGKSIDMNPDPKASDPEQFDADLKDAWFENILNIPGFMIKQQASAGKLATEAANKAFSGDDAKANLEKALGKVMKDAADEFFGEEESSSSKRDWLKPNSPERLFMKNFQDKAKTAFNNRVRSNWVGYTWYHRNNTPLNPQEKTAAAKALLKTALTEAIEASLDEAHNLEKRTPGGLAFDRVDEKRRSFLFGESELTFNQEMSQFIDQQWELVLNGEEFDETKHLDRLLKEIEALGPDAKKMETDFMLYASIKTHMYLSLLVDADIIMNACKDAQDRGPMFYALAFAMLCMQTGNWNEDTKKATLTIAMNTAYYTKFQAMLSHRAHVFLRVLDHVEKMYEDKDGDFKWNDFPHGMSLQIEKVKVHKNLKVENPNVSKKGKGKGSPLQKGLEVKTEAGGKRRRRPSSKKRRRRKMANRKQETSTNNKNKQQAIQQED